MMVKQEFIIWLKNSYSEEWGPDAHIIIGEFK